MSARAPTDRLLAQVAHLVRAALQRVVEGLRYAVHVPLHPPLHGVLDLANVVLHPEAFALSEQQALAGGRATRNERTVGKGVSRSGRTKIGQITREGYRRGGSRTGRTTRGKAVGKKYPTEGGGRHEGKERGDEFRVMLDSLHSPSVPRTTTPATTALAKKTRHTRPSRRGTGRSTKACNYPTLKTASSSDSIEPTLK